MTDRILKALHESNLIAELESVSLRYENGPYVFKDVSLGLARGGFYFLTGPSGSGKSSLLRLLHIGQMPSKGYLRLFGSDIRTLSRYQRMKMRRRIGVVFQDFRLLDHLNAFENVALPLRAMHKSEAEIQANVREIMQWVGLGRNERQYPSQLSGGEQQRLAIARAVINKPSLILADEPTGNVDDENGERLIGLFQELHRLGTTVLFATHSMHLLDRYAYPCLNIADQQITVSVPDMPNHTRTALQSGLSATSVSA